MTNNLQRRKGISYETRILKRCTRTLALALGLVASSAHADGGAPLLLFIDLPVFGSSRFYKRWLLANGYGTGEAQSKAESMLGSLLSEIEASVVRRHGRAYKLRR